MEQPQNRSHSFKPEAAVGPSEEPPPPSQAQPARIAHTLTACCRCRTRKTRCDPGLPRCGPCERTNSHCEYFDPTKSSKIPRNYVVWLQHRVRDLELQLAELEKDDLDPDPELMVRNAASVRIHESDESKFLGPASGIAITRLVMQLAKQFTDSKSITDIVPQSRARLIKQHFAEEEAKPTSKIYPLISDVAAEELPNRDLTNQLVQLFYLKVHPMYPLFHEPSFDQDVEDVFNGTAEPFKNFALRMVIAISLQKMSTQYAGLADSYYLAALEHFEGVVRLQDLRTLQAYALVAGYSLLTPTRTAVYYIIGLAVRLCQTLGLHEEATVTRGRHGRAPDPLEVDMRRRTFWAIITMEYGLAHSLGRPSHFATGRDHLDVGFFEMVDDKYITRDGVMAGPASLKKWISIHFIKMRLLQLEIRRKLYLRKKPEPKDDRDPWFLQMEEKLAAWRDASPNMDGESGLNKMWFTGRYNTMIVFLLRPSPQVPRPSVRAAVQCYNACEFNIHMSYKQIEMKSVDLTWIFTQAIFMTINTMLWSLSYSEIRRMHSKDEVERHLNLALDAIEKASERWPGVVSALELYRNLIDACMKIYDKDGDIPIAAGSPSNASVASTNTNTTDGGINRSRTTSPASVSNSSLATPPEKHPAPFGYITPQASGPPSSARSTPLSHHNHHHQQQSINSVVSSPDRPATSGGTAHVKSESVPHIHFGNIPTLPYDPGSQFNPLPQTFADFGAWNPNFSMGQSPDALNLSPPLQQMSVYDPQGYLAPTQLPTYPEYAYEPAWVQHRPSLGLTQAQQLELMQSLEGDVGQIETMIQQSNAIWNPQAVRNC